MGAADTVRADEEKARDEAFAQCDRFLYGHLDPKPHDALADLAAEAGEAERSDMYGTGALIESFEREIAQVLGKDAALFLPSGTMAQQIALRIWADRSGRTSVAFHPTCHLEIHEQKGYQILHGLHGRLVGERHRLITLEDLQATAGPLAALLLELPQREIGGLLPAWSDLVAQTAWARDRGIAVHMDGARLWEAGPCYERSYAEIAALFDSVYVSFYKGVGGLAGAALAGSAEFIAEARPWQRRYGGNLIRLYPFVLSARMNLRKRLPLFASYHQRALEVARVLREIPGVAISPDPPHSHMMQVYLRGDADRLLAAAADIARSERIMLFRSLSPTGVPGTSVFELAIGDAAVAIADDELRTLFQRLMTGAGA